MKVIRLCLITIFCLMILNLKAQETHEIRINFATKSIDKLDCFEIGDYYQIVVDNINLNLWKVSLNTADTILSSPLVTPTFGNINIEALSAIVSNLKEVASEIKFSSEDIRSPSLTDRDQKEISKRLNQENETLNELIVIQNSIKDRIDRIIYEVGKKQLSAYDEGNVIPTTFDIEQALENIEKLRKDIDLEEKKITKKKNCYESFSEKYNVSKIEKYTDADKANRNAYGKLEVSVRTIKEAMSAEKCIELLKSIVFLKNNHGTYISMPIQFKSDQAIVNLNFEPRNSEYNLQSYTMPFVFPVRNDIYWSIGLSYYGSFLCNQRYTGISVHDTDSTQAYQIVDSTKQKFEIGIASILRVGWVCKENRNFGIHGSIGPGITIAEKVMPRLLLGGGVSYGNNNRHSISLDIGGNIGYVDRTSNAIDIKDTRYPPESLTVSKLAIGVYIALGYFYKL